MSTNTAFQSKSLESFFKPNTNMTTPFVSPFRPQASPFKPVSMPGAAGQDGGDSAPGQPDAQPTGLNPQMQTSPDQGYLQTPIQPAMMPLTVPVMDDVSVASEE